MPRLARLDVRPPRLSPTQADDGGQAPGVLHDVIMRGIDLIILLATSHFFHEFSFVLHDINNISLYHEKYDHDFPFFCIGYWYTWKIIHDIRPI